MSVIDYDFFLNESQRYLIKKVLQYIEAHGLPDKHKIYITYKTCHENVVISDSLREKYPNVITIVLENDFHSLKVYEEHFEVDLSFSRAYEKISVPFKAIMVFADPFKMFEIRFDENDEFKQVNDYHDNIISLESYRKGKG